MSERGYELMRKVTLNVFWLYVRQSGCKRL